ncbi:rhodanese-like domain-containing protein [Kangiella sp. HZ709]|uniref:rhodanese-like domain-containing protein n=1 Tax=Kangiella sp. HZ709 TaxID=2666328 RepID=UPI0012B0F379|nr:rhodanese-like domain-containing protein [Kangiella sp. HZ709]MRX27978.1 rhodanese [Kangiella sp. HZ709]
MKPCIVNYMQTVKSQITEVTIDDLQAALAEGALVFDVREPQEHSQGVVPGALAIPRGVLEFNLFNLPMLKDLSEEAAFDKPVYIYCASGGRSACAANSLQQIGFNRVFSVAGGIKAWTDSGKQLIKP